MICSRNKYGTGQILNAESQQISAEALKRLSFGEMPRLLAPVQLERKR